jgi:polygalacturonase
MQTNTLIVRIIQSGIRYVPVALATLAVGSLASCQPRASSKGALAAAASRPPSGERAKAGGELPPEPRIPPACTTLLADKAAVKDTLADADETKPDTDRIQSAIDGCPEGRSVQLKSDGGKNAFLAGPLKMAKGVTLWVDKGTTLFASRNPREYDVRAGACGSDDHDDSGGCKPLILVEKVSDVGIMGEGVIDGRGGEPMLGSKTTWWDVAQDAKVRNLKHSNPRLIDVKKAKNFTLYKISLHNSPKFHVGLNAQGYVVWGVTLLTPSKATNSQGKPLTAKYARNTDGIDPSAALDGVIAYSSISVGDDQIAIKGGDQGPTSNLIIAHNRFGTGHGMSIGSETNSGVSRVYVYDLAIDGDVDTGGAGDVNLNGIRIKSDPTRGGEVTDITYTDVCMRGMANPILLTPHYSKDEDANSIPVYKRIVLNNVRSMKGANAAVKPVVTLEGYDGDNILEATLNNVIIDGIAPSGVKAQFADIALGPGPVNFQPAGEDVMVESRVAGNAPPNPCTGKFPEAAKR